MLEQYDRTSVVTVLIFILAITLLDTCTIHAKILDINVGKNKDKSEYYKQRSSQFRQVLKRTVKTQSTTKFKAIHDPKVTERDFLRKFYNQTGGRYWKNNDGWNTMDTKDEVDYCKWYGVDCEESGHFVWGLRLGNNNLTGSLPTGIVDALPSLMFFVIPVNGLRGIIPEEYGHTTLTDIDLSYNQFEGVLPHGICNILTCSAHNNPRLMCPKDNCNNNHCVMDVCNCGVWSVCLNEADCNGKLCSKCVPSSASPYIKVCR